MCECGCYNATQWLWRLPGPFVIGVYPGCADCETGIGIRIVRAPSDWITKEELRGIPYLRFLGDGDFCQPILSINALREALKDHLQGCLSGDPEQNDAGLFAAEFIQERFRQLFSDTMKEMESLEQERTKP